MYIDIMYNPYVYGVMLVFVICLCIMYQLKCICIYIMYNVYVYGVMLVNVICLSITYPFILCACIVWFIALELSFYIIASSNLTLLFILSAGIAKLLTKN